MLGKIVIRKELPEDYKKTEHMVMRSFWNKFGPGCMEHLMVRIIRESEDYLPEFSRVAEYNGQIVGAIFCTKAYVVDGDTKHEVITFGPLAVEPMLEGNNIGGALLREMLEQVKMTDIPGIVFVGEPGYYPRYGFERCANHGITDADGNVYDALQCLPMNDSFLDVKGKFYESSDFEKLSDAERLEQMNKEFPAYRKVKIINGFLQIGEQHFGVVESIDGDVYQIRYWEKIIRAKLAEDINKSPKVGSDVLFVWNHKGESVVTKVVNEIKL